MNLFSRLRRARRLSCADVNAFLAAYLDGDLDGRARARFEAHVARCPQCGAFMDQYRATIALARDAEPLPEPPPFMAELVLRVLRESGEGEPPPA